MILSRQRDRTRRYDAADSRCELTDPVTQTHKWLVIAILAKALLLTWFWSQGHPRPTGDMVMFKQPSYMFLHTGHFSVPSFRGTVPHAEEVFGAYTPFYTYATLATFKLFGVSHYATLGVDLLIHLTLTVIVAIGIWRVTRRQPLAVLYLLCSTVMLTPIGRPEELAVLLVLIALWRRCRTSSRLWMSAVFLGLASLTAPTTGLSGCVGLALIEWNYRVCFRRWLLEMAGAGVIHTCVFFVGWLPALLPRWDMAFEQFRSHASNHLVVPLPVLMELFGAEARLYVGLPLLVGLGIGIDRWTRKDSPNSYSPWLAIVGGMLLICAFIVVFLQRLFYDFRLLGHIAIFGAAILAASWATDQGGWRPWCGRIVCVVVLAVTAVNSADLVRYTLLPFAWSDESFSSFHDAEEAVSRLVPIDASIGGDPSLCWTIKDGRPFDAIFFSTLDGVHDWPEYLVSTGFWNCRGKPELLKHDEIEAVVNSHYVEITQPVGDVVTSISVADWGMHLPLSRNRCDWYVRVWKKRSSFVR